MTCKKYPERRKSIKTELARLGIAFDEIYDDGTAFQNIGFKHKHLNRCHLAKYNALLRFASNPAERATLIEDDVRFLKNISEISEAIKKIPKGFGVCRLSWGASPYIRKEIESINPKLVVETERNMSQSGSFWVECPWASTDGCTIISKPVAMRFLQKLSTLVESQSDTEMDNSDDLLCRVCEELKMSMYAFKPLVCIQVIPNSGETGKSAAWKFLSESEYYVSGITRSKDEYALQSGDCANSKVETQAPTATTLRKGYNLYRKPSLLPRAKTLISIPKRFCANPTKH